MIPSCAVGTIAASVQHHRSLNPASASNKRVMEEYLATVSPELELASGSLCKACQEGCDLPCYAENITNELREKFAFSL